MRHFDCRTRGICSTAIHFDLDDTGSTIESVSFDGGCNGNLKAISKLVRGKSVDEVCDLLEGNTCGPRQTSCTDQMARAMRAAQAQIRS